MKRKQGPFPYRWKPLRFRRQDYFKMELLRKRFPPVWRRGPYALKMPRYGIDKLEMRAAPESETGPASLEERIVYRELQRRKIPFDFQSSMRGGRQSLHGMVADFLLPGQWVVIRVQGTIWHTGLEAETRDKIQKAEMEKMGYRVIDIWDWQIRDEKLFNDIMDRYFGGAL